MNYVMNVSCRQASTCIGVLLSLSLPLSLPAQQFSEHIDVDQAIEGTVDVLTPLHTAAPDMGQAYGVWGAGPDYKVSFHDGATFVPLLGRDYPHNQPWAWQTRSAKVGGVELVTHAPKLAYDDLRAQYALGGIVEAYDLRTDGVEQTFVLDRHPGVAGDLVIRGVVETMLRAEPVAELHGGVAFFDREGRELVTYGAATAIDANGAALAMTTSWVDGEMTLRLNGDWLAGATFPVVVDPLLGPGDQVTGGSRGSVDVVRDNEGNTGEVWVAYSSYASATDGDIYMRRFDDNGDWTASAFQDLSSGYAALAPSVAYCAGANKVVCVYERYWPLTGTRALRCHAHERTNMVTTTNVFSIPATGNAWRADVGGTLYSGVEAMVVFQQEANAPGTFVDTSSSGVYGCRLNLTTEAAGLPFVIADSDFFVDYGRPSINQYAHDLFHTDWRIAYQARSTLAITGSSDDWDVSVVSVDDSENVSPALILDGASSYHTFAPKIAGNADDYYVAHVASPNTGTAPSGTNGHQLRVSRIDWPSGGGAGSAPHGTVTIQSNGDARLDLGSICFDRRTRSHAMVLFRSTITNSIYLRLCGMTGQQTRAETVFTPPAGTESVLGGLSFDQLGNAFQDFHTIGGGDFTFRSTKRLQLGITK